MSELVYSRPAATWLECLPLGSGRLGAMLDGGLPHGTVYLNEATAWSGSPSSEGVGAPSSEGVGAPSAEVAQESFARSRELLAAGDVRGAEAALRGMQSRYSQAYIPLATLTFTVDGDAGAGVRRSLDLAEGIHRTASGDVSQLAFTTRELDVLVIATSGTTALDFALESPLRELARLTGDDETALLLRLPSDVAPGHEPDLPGAVWRDDALPAAVVARRVGTVLYVAAATTFPEVSASPEVALADARARLDAAELAGVDALLARHREVHREAMDRVAFDFGASPELDTDARLEAAAAAPEGALAHDPALIALLADYGRYLLWSASRAGGLPPNLQGLWNAELRPPWSSNYTINVNTQINHWGSYVTDLPETAEALTEFVLGVAEAGASTASRLYGLPGWVAHHNSDAWHFTSPVGRGSGDVRWAFWPWGGAWLARHLVEPLQFGAAGREHAERIWPALRGAAEFALAWHHRAPDGSWSTAPSASPENAWLEADGTPVALDDSAAMDLALLHDLLRNATDVAGMLGLENDPVVLAARERLAVVPAQPAIGADGRLLEWSQPRTEEDPHHRHQSHLYGLFPGAGDWDAPHRAAAAATLEARGDDSSGWALIWRTALWARLGRADMTEALIDLLVRPVTDGRGPWAAGLYPNLFAAHPPFQIDGNLGFPAALAECLLQSHDGIELLPALPAGLANGSVRGLIARPGVRVELSWADGRLVAATLTPRADGDLAVRYAGAELVLAGAAGAPIILGPTAFDLRRNA